MFLQKYLKYCIRLKYSKDLTRELDYFSHYLIKDLKAARLALNITNLFPLET